MQRRHILDVFLMRIKCVVKNVIIFDLIFDTNQKRANPIFRAVYKCIRDRKQRYSPEKMKTAWELDRNSLAGHNMKSKMISTGVL